MEAKKSKKIPKKEYLDYLQIRKSLIDDGLFIYAKRRQLADSIKMFHKIEVCNIEHLEGQGFVIPQENLEEHIEELVFIISNITGHSIANMFALAQMNKLEICFVEDDLEYWLHVFYHPIQEAYIWSFNVCPSEVIPEDII